MDSVQHLRGSRASSFTFTFTLQTTSSPSEGEHTGLAGPQQPHGATWPESSPPPCSQAPRT